MLSADKQQVQSSARDKVYAIVRDGMLKGDFPPGSFIEEEQICQLVGVSRTPVREAFHRLAAERYLELLPRRGAMVRQVTGRELAEIYEARVLIESHAARHICRHRLPVPPGMNAVLEEMKRSDQNDHVLAGELNRRFHREMVLATGNDVLAELFESLQSRLLRTAVSALRADPSRARIILEEHERIVQALRDSNEPEVIAALEQHLKPQALVMARLP